MFVKEVTQAIENLIVDGQIVSVGKLFEKKAAIVGEYRGKTLEIKLSMFMTLESVLQGYSASTDLDLIFDGHRLIGTHLNSPEEIEMIKVAWKMAEDAFEAEQKKASSEAWKILGIE